MRTHLIPVALLAIGCGTESSPTLGSTNQSVQEDNGRSLNGRSLNGVLLNGASLAGAQLKDLDLDGTRLKGIDSDGHKLSGKDFIGATLVGTLDDGSALDLSIEDITEKGGVLQYVVNYATDGGPQYFCGTDANGQGLPATALAGLWDYRAGVAGGGSHIDDPKSFTFACIEFALGKCVDLGYQPWKTKTLCTGSGNTKKCVKTSLAPVHQACTRALRADYCGDGTSYTVDGTLIDISDVMGIQKPSKGSWSVEAEWSDAGAVCLEDTRIAGTHPSCNLPTSCAAANGVITTEFASR